MKTTILNISLGVVIATLVIFSMVGIRNLFYNWYPDQSWMIIKQVHIPDFKYGEEGRVFYDRKVLVNFQADWFVEARESKTSAQVATCEGKGTADYGIKEGPVDWTLDYYVGSRCYLPPGCYYLRTTWYIKYGDWRRKTPIVNISNNFCVIGDTPND